MGADSLRDVIQFNNNFKSAINLYLSLNKPEKILSYIPTRSSNYFIKEYISAVKNSKEQATLLIGPYGKGKSHLLLVLLAILSLERNKQNQKIIEEVCAGIEKVDEEGAIVADDIRTIWNQKRFLPVIINDTKGDLNQSFLTALNDALKREGLDDIAPETYYSIALERIDDWENNYSSTYTQFVKELKKSGTDAKKLRSELKLCAKEALEIFIAVYPKVTAGSTFNPLAASDVLPLYKGISEKLVEEKGFEGIYIVFDEFSKFIEGLNGISVGNNMKLLQDICELATESTNAKVFITMVAHKSIKEYGKYLSQEIINAFTGIEGRLIEKYFVTSSKNNYELIRHAIIKDEKEFKDTKAIQDLVGADTLDKYYKFPVFSGQFEKQDFDSIILKGCFPLNPLSAYLLLNISEKVAQNERTLFTFISNDEPNSLARYVQDHSCELEWGVGADLIYDYFSGLFKKDVLNELVHSVWLNAENALSKCKTDDEKKIIKAMALIQIVNKPEEVVASDSYIRLSVRISDESAFDALKDRQIIYIKASTGAYVFKTKAGTELRTEIKRQKEIKGDSVNYGKALMSITNSQFIVPRKYNSIHEMTRYFDYEFMDIDTFLSLNDPDILFDYHKNADGIAVCLYSFSSTKQADVKRHFLELACGKMIVIAPKKKLTVENQLKEYSILQEIKENHEFITNNEVMKREIPLLEEDIEAVVMEQFSRAYKDDDECLVLSFIGDRVKSHSAGSIEEAVNDCCEKVYFKTPIINNEIINRSVISSAQTKKTRINIIAEILQKRGKVEEEFYSGTNQEATVFRSLLVRTGIINDREDGPLSEIIHSIDEYIDSCCDKRVSFATLINRLTSAPYGMRKGVLPIYLAYKMSQRNEDLVFYYADGEVQLSPDIVVNVCENPENYSLFVPKESKEREDYIRSLNELFGVPEARNLTDNRIKNIVICMQRWFRSLPQVSRNAANLDNFAQDTLNGKMRIVKNILQRVEFNPYEILFVELPEDFKCKTFASTFKKTKECKEAYDSYYDWNVQAAVEEIYKIFGGKRKTDLFHVLKEWYEKQSDLSKQGLHSGRVTNLMSCIEKLDVYDDYEIAKKIVKSITDVYIDNWTDGSISEFVDNLSETKRGIEGLRQESGQSQRKLCFIGKSGKPIEKFYEPVDESTGSVLRNILEDTLEEFDDLSVNDRVGILLEMIESIIG